MYHLRSIQCQLYVELCPKFSASSPTQTQTYKIILSQTIIFQTYQLTLCDVLKFMHCSIQACMNSVIYKLICFIKKMLIYSFQTASVGKLLKIMDGSCTCKHMDQYPLFIIVFELIKLVHDFEKSFQCYLSEANQISILKSMNCILLAQHKFGTNMFVILLFNCC